MDRKVSEGVQKKRTRSFIILESYEYQLKFFKSYENLPDENLIITIEGLINVRKYL